MSTGLELGEVVGEGRVDLSGDVASEAAHGLAFGLALGDASLQIGLGPLAVAEPDHDGHVQRPVGATIATRVEPVTLGLSGGGLDRRCCAQVREGSLDVEPVDVLTGGAQQLRGVLGPDSERRHRSGCCLGDELVELSIERLNLVVELLDAPAEGVHRDLGGLQRFVGSVEVGA